MGHLVNPVSVRLSVNHFWNSNWVLINNFNYINLVKNDYLFFQFFHLIFRKRIFYINNFLFSHYKIYRTGSNIYINLHYYYADREDARASYLYQIDPYYYKLLQINDWVRFSHKLIKRFLHEFILTLIWFILMRFLQVFFWRLNRNPINYCFNLYNIRFWDITSEIVSKYIALKLQRRNTLGWVLKPVIRDLQIRIGRKRISGYKIVCSGRFTRKQIATYSWEKRGALGFSTLTSYVRYSQSKVRLKYGLCGIKVWIGYVLKGGPAYFNKTRLFIPLYTPFKFIYDRKLSEFRFFINKWYFSFVRILSLKRYGFKMFSNYLKHKLYVIFWKYFSTISTKWLRLRLEAFNTVQVMFFPFIKFFNFKKLRRYIFVTAKKNTYDNPIWKFRPPKPKRVFTFATWFLRRYRYFRRKRLFPERLSDVLKRLKWSFSFYGIQKNFKQIFYFKNSYFVYQRFLQNLKISKRKRYRKNIKKTRQKQNLININSYFWFGFRGYRFNKFYFKKKRRYGRKYNRYNYRYRYFNRHKRLRRYKFGKLRVLSLIYTLYRDKKINYKKINYKKINLYLNKFTGNNRKYYKRSKFRKKGNFNKSSHFKHFPFKKTKYKFKNFKKNYLSKRKRHSYKPKLKKLTNIRNFRAKSKISTKSKPLFKSKVVKTNKMYKFKKKHSKKYLGDYSHYLRKNIKVEF